ncbi:hypothetical protein [Bremerella cremea]|uniref:type IV pilus modification PilV family protein n=1 Tax=Bremerella cremea TaxID=1031537 RepID=UPI0031EEDD2C
MDRIVRKHPTHRPGQAGVTLIEVMMSTMVVSLGILGLAALIPLGTHLTERGTRNDRIASLGPRAFHQAKAMGYFNPQNWTDATPIGIVFGPAGSSMPYRQPYMLDPMFFGTNGTDATRGMFPYADRFAHDNSTGLQTASYTTTKRMRMPRLSVERGGSTAALSFAQAKIGFQTDDDVAVTRPSDGDLPPYQTFFQRGATPASVKRQAAGEYSWMIMLTPEPFALGNVSAMTSSLNTSTAQALRPPLNTGSTALVGMGVSNTTEQNEVRATLANSVTDEYTAHVIIMKERQGRIPTAAIAMPATTEVVRTNERILQVVSGSFIPTGGYSTGEVNLQVTTSLTQDEVEDSYLKFSNGDWICLAGRMSIGGNTSFPRGDLYQWYRVVMADDLQPESSLPGFSRNLTISGPDWPGDSPPTHAIAVEGVVGVYSKRVTLESQNPWTP